MTLPIVRDDASAVFFDGLDDGELLIWWCRNCEMYSAPRVVQCDHCGSTSLDWKPSSGIASLVSWTIPHGRDGAETVIAGLVELNEGPWLRARLVDVEPGRLFAGMPLTVGYESSGEGGESIPVFRPQ